MAESLSHSQSLRVIGQDLDAFGIDSFELAKSGDDYIVWLEYSEFARRLSAAKRFFSRLGQKILGRDVTEREVPTRLYFTPSGLLSADTQRRLKRKISSSSSDRRDLSFGLRVIGDYLDRKQAREFTVLWSRDSATISHDHNEERFTSQNLYDLGIAMYLKRSSRTR